MNINDFNTAPSLVNLDRYLLDNGRQKQGLIMSELVEPVKVGKFYYCEFMYQSNGITAKRKSAPGALEYRIIYLNEWSL